MDLNELAFTVDQFVQIRQERLDADKVAASLKAEESKLSDTILEAMIDSDMNMVGGKIKRVTRRVTQQPIVEDWEKVREYILSTGNTQLLQKRIAVGAYKELTECGTIPGTDLMEVNKLSVAKL